MWVNGRGARCGRNIYESMDSGKIVFNTTDSRKKLTERTTYVVKKGEVIEMIRELLKKQKKDHIIYSVGREIWKKGKLISQEKYRRGSNQARVFKGEWKKEKANLGDFSGTLIQRCYGGSFRSEKFVYASGKEAYRVYYGQKQLKVFYPDGKLWVHISGRIDFAWKQSIRESIFPENNDYNSAVKGDSWEVVVYDYDEKKGKVFTKGRAERRQKTGEWTENGKEAFYMSGVKVGRKLFFAKPEDLDGNEILQIPNAQLRTSLLKRMGFEKLLEQVKGKVIDEKADGSVLFEFSVKSENDYKDKTMKVLKVICPSSGNSYLLQVPPDAKTCDEARNWTFQTDGDRDAVELEKET